MVYDIKNTKVIYLGRQGENLARTIEIDVSSMLMKWPDATISLLVQRNQEDTFYLAPVVIENGILKWTITNADTEIAGIGKIEVRAIRDDAIMKSATMKICVENSLGGTETDVPDPVQTWVDTIVAASVQAKQSAEDASGSATNAAGSAAAAADVETNVEGMVETIAKEPTAQEILAVMQQELALLKQMVDDGISGGGDLNSFSFALGENGELVISYTNPEDETDTAIATFATKAQAQEIAQTLYSTNELLRSMAGANATQETEG